MLKPVYQTTDGKTCTCTNLQQDVATGALYRNPSQNGPAMTISQAAANQIPVYPANLLTGRGGLDLANSLTIRPAENVGGKLEMYRQENGGSLSGTLMQFTISLANGTGSAVLVPLGDANKCIELAQSWAAVPAGVTVGGTFGTNTLAQIKLITGHNPLRIHSMRVSASTQPVLAASYIKNWVSNAIGETTVADTNLSTWLSPNQYQNTLVENSDYRFILDGFAAIAVTVPAGGTLTITMNVAAVAQSYGMVKQS